VIANHKPAETQRTVDPGIGIDPFRAAADKAGLLLFRAGVRSKAWHGSSIDQNLTHTFARESIAD